MMQKKIIRRTIPQHINLPDSMHPVLRRVFAARAVESVDEVDYSLASLLPFSDLSGIEQAVDLLQTAILEKKRILVVADFDADGATSCALAIRGLSMMGHDDTVYVVPNRFEYGYGLTPEIVDVALDYDPDLLITVDNGISSVAGVKHAKQHGLQVLITDHHLPAEVLPAADAMINPQLVGDNFPSKNLAGVGVVFYLLLALRARLKSDGWFEANNIPYPNLAQRLDLVALGTVADVVPLDRNNRIMVAHGLKLIRNNKSVAGIEAILNQAGRAMHTLSASDLGFAIAPRLNAAGRLRDMSLGIECLITDEQKLAKDMADQLDKLNKERKQIQDEMQVQALLKLEDELQDAFGKLQHGISLYNRDWHQGVVGILAAKVKEMFNRPVIAFAYESDGILKGSARSITGLHIRDLLESMTRIYPDLILTFGGHAMAAGLTIKESHFQAFSDGFNTLAAKQAGQLNLNNSCFSDGELSADDMNLELASDIQTAGPWGQAFPEPVFDGTFKLINKRIVGGHHLKMKLQAPDSDKIIDAISFNNTDEYWPAEVEAIHAAYKLDINEFRNRQTLQLMIEHIEPLSSFTYG